jgi:nitrogen regulatory protein PII 2
LSELKEVIAIIRPNKISATKEALADAGFPGITVLSVLGRGKQRGIVGEVRIAVNPELLAKGRTGAAMKFIPKRMISLIVNDEDVKEVIKVIMSINETAHIGDGRVFVAPIDNAIRVRTGEEGSEAITF